MNTKKKEKRIMLNIRVSLKERKALLAAAKKFTKGNLSLWLRVAGLAYKPR